MSYLPVHIPVLCQFNWLFCMEHLKLDEVAPIIPKHSCANSSPFAKSTSLPIYINVSLEFLTWHQNCLKFWMYYLGVIFCESLSFLALIVEIWDHSKDSFWRSLINHYTVCKTSLDRLGWLNTILGSLIVIPSLLHYCYLKKPY